MSDANNWNEFFNDKNLFIAEPILKGTQSWMRQEDIGDSKKARFLPFDALAGNNLYMSSIRKDNQSYVKLYIKNSRYIRIVYVRSDAVSQGTRYHHNPQEN